MPTAWEESPGSERLIEANVQRVLTEIASIASERRPPTVAQAQQWHRKLYDDIPRPFDYYAGEMRDSDQRFPMRSDHQMMTAVFDQMLRTSLEALD